MALWAPRGGLHAAEPGVRLPLRQQRRWRFAWGWYPPRRSPALPWRFWPAPWRWRASTGGRAPGGGVARAVPDALQRHGLVLQASFRCRRRFQQLAGEIKGPLGKRFAACAHQLETGHGSSEALGALRAGGKRSELAFVAVALDVQHQAGGSMRPVLEAARETVEGELALRRALRVQTAQARLSARVVTVMPFALVAVFSLVSKGFLDPFLQKPAGVGPVGLGMCDGGCGRARGATHVERGGVVLMYTAAPPAMRRSRRGVGRVHGLGGRAIGSPSPRGKGPRARWRAGERWCAGERMPFYRGFEQAIGVGGPLARCCRRRIAVRGRASRSRWARPVLAGRCRQACCEGAVRLAAAVRRRGALLGCAASNELAVAGCGGRHRRRDRAGTRGPRGPAPARPRAGAQHVGDAGSGGARRAQRAFVRSQPAAVHRAFR